MTKKAISLLFIFVLLTAFNSCSYETRIDFSELIRRINTDDTVYKADIEEAFIYEDEWFLFTDTLNENDILISANADEDGILTYVCISTINSGDEKQKEIFSDFCKRTVKAFTVNHNTEQIIKESGIENTDSLFSEGAVFSENGRFSTSLYTAELGSSFIIEIRTSVRN